MIIYGSWQKEYKMKNNIIRLKCNCSSEMLEIEYDEELGTYDFSLWNRWFNRNMSLRERIKWCYRIITTGNPWTDYIILGQKDIDEMVEFLNDKTEKQSNVVDKRQLLLDIKN